MRSASKRAMRKSGRGAPERANTEIEVRFRVADGARLMRQLARLKAKPTRARVHEMNTLYDTADGNLSRHGQMLRLRVERPAARANGAGKRGKTATGKSESCTWLTLKGPANGAKASELGRYKVREEHELRIFDHQEMPKILEALGLRP